MEPVKWKNPPADFDPITWCGNGTDIKDINGVVHPIKRVTIFKFELTKRRATTIN